MSNSAPLQMLDLRGQYQRYRAAIDAAVQQTLSSGYFIGGPQVADFREALETYLDIAHVIPCANGTDALQIALMALDLAPGDEVIVPAFTYVSTAEVIGLLGLVPVMADVDPATFNLRAEDVAPLLTERTRAIVPVHLFGQSADMAPLLELAAANECYVVEDNAQAIGAVYTFPDGRTRRTGGMGQVGTTSFYPSKNLGAYGDGGAMTTNDDALAKRLRSIANHGQSERRYYHDAIGVNSRLDALQAGILGAKLPHLAESDARRGAIADRYDAAFAALHELHVPQRAAHSTHVFHQYTVRVADERREALRAHLQGHGVPSMIYYPVPLYRQQAYAPYHDGRTLENTERLCREVLSLPIDPLLTDEQVDFVIDRVNAFYH